MSHKSSCVKGLVASLWCYWEVVGTNERRYVIESDLEGDTRIPAPCPHELSTFAPPHAPPIMLCLPQAHKQHDQPTKAYMDCKPK
jgi:hypothetical protein